MSIIQDLILSLLESSLLVLMVLRLIEGLNKGYLRLAVIYVFICSFFSIGTTMVGIKGYFSFILNVFIGYFMFVLLFKMDKFKALIIYAFSFFLVLMNQLLVISVFGMIFEGFNYSFLWGVISGSVNLIIGYAIILWLPLDGIIYYINEENTKFQRIVINIAIVFLALSYIWQTDYKNMVNMGVVILVIILLTIVVNTVIAENGMKNMSLVQQNNMYSTYIPIIEDAIEEVRIKQHDFNNHLSVLDTLAKNEEYKNYRDRMEENSDWQEVLKIDNKVITALFFSKRKRAAEKDVKLEFDIDIVSIKTNIPDYELVEMVGELLENAIRAAEDTVDKLVLVSVTSESGKCLIKVSNSTKPLDVASVPTFFDKGMTTKNEVGHGMGLYKIKHILKKYNGAMEYEYFDGDEWISICVRLVGG